MIMMRFSQSEFILHDLWQIKDFLTIFIHSMKKEKSFTAFHSPHLPVSTVLSKQDLTLNICTKHAWI